MSEKLPVCQFGIKCAFNKFPPGNCLIRAVNLIYLLPDAQYDEDHARMKRFLPFFAGICFFLGFCRPAEAFSYDKVAHGGVSFAVTTVAYGFYKTILPKDPLWKNVLRAALTSMVLGVGKEFTDRGFDGQDILANGMGTASAATVILVFDL